MTLRAAALRYSEFLLRQITRAADRRRWDQVHSLCDRFERVMDHLPPVPDPLVWAGDYA